MNQERVIELLEAERKRLARDIHDGPAQYLTNTSMRIEILKKLIESHHIDQSLQEVERLQAAMRAAINDVRRMIFDLRPTFLERGVTDAIRFYAERFSQTFGIAVEVQGDWPEVTMSRNAEVAVFRVFQEVLNNVHKHAGAHHVVVRLVVLGSHYRMSIADDGVGMRRDVDISGSYGWRGIEERISLVNGHVRVESEPGQGTCVICEVPADHE